LIGGHGASVDSIAVYAIAPSPPASTPSGQGGDESVAGDEAHLSSAPPASSAPIGTAYALSRQYVTSAGTRIAIAAGMAAG
jgi:hypothetical protein